MDQLDAFDEAMREFDSRVRLVERGQWDLGTPCAEWSVRDLVNHVTGEHLWAPFLFDGATLEDVGDRFDGDVLGNHAADTWARAAAASREAFHAPGALDRRVHTSMGLIPAADYAWQMIGDLAVHGWDLARGIDVNDRIDPQLAQTLYDYMSPHVQSWQGSGVFAAPVEVPDDAPAQDRLVALLGRRP
ncbi:TIGR03086 family metal-binding protein [Yinghuangia seranimata]|uniref:TIGR03086 family metal-binding protein n=1 Tax=Yinghuangia seranimata TaxID=408067 RepID=UPI00248C58B6|nr:TIGR03086 family metal-binding protein [Yinghuangia seranimata]MDI2126135.1 TIGR03086 family metal-binding protein [Yinghuangia seranimata]